MSYTVHMLLLLAVKQALPLVHRIIIYTVICFILYVKIFFHKNFAKD